MSGSAAADVVLETRGLCKRFGGITAASDVSLRIQRGARHALIGPNGAGKTTLVNLLTGVFAPSSGSIHLNGEDVTALPAHRRAQRGLIRTFQINQLFASFTPRQTLALVVSVQRGISRRWWQSLAADAAVAERAERLLAQFHLGDVADRRTAELPYGKQRLLEIAIAIAGQPRVLLLDEPVAGVPAGERREILETVAALPADVSVLLIEHDMDLVFSFAKHMTVLVNGALFRDGPPEQIAADAEVRAVYLGEPQSEPAHG